MTLPGSVVDVITASDRGELSDHWSFQQLLRRHLESRHPAPEARGKTRAEILVEALVAGATKQAMSGAARADLVKLVIEHVDGSETSRRADTLRGDSLTDVQFLIVDPVGSDTPVKFGGDAPPAPSPDEAL